MTGSETLVVTYNGVPLGGSSGYMVSPEWARQQYAALATPHHRSEPQAEAPPLPSPFIERVTYRRRIVYKAQRMIRREA